MKRVFVAINLPEEIKKTLGEFQKEIKNYFPKAKWVKLENLHLTLTFLGEIGLKKTKLLVEILPKILEEVTSFSLTLSGLGVFPNPAKAKILWVNLTDGGVVKLLNQALYLKLTKEGFLLDDREFSPHITIARFPEKPSKNKVLLFLKNFGGGDFGKIKVESIEAMESVLKREGVEYRVIEKIKLT